MALLFGFSSQEKVLPIKRSTSLRRTQ